MDSVDGGKEYSEEAVSSWRSHSHVAQTYIAALVDLTRPSGSPASRG